ncbi:MAG TPA: hypothetical protein VMK42_05530 [Anaeromyxobacteraceae bacterium]|nr:hypothetical protein [Anaeromyxobacteraceae bacterium]
MTRAALEGWPDDVADLELARDDLLRRLASDPRDARAWALLAEVERARGQSRTARLCAAAASSLRPDGAAGPEAAERRLDLGRRPPGPRPAKR